MDIWLQVCPATGPFLKNLLENQIGHSTDVCDIAEIGTPLQSVQVQIDTGSYELWVNPECANSASPSYCAQFNVYDPDKSSTASDVGYGFDLVYGTGEASGEYLIDDIVIGSSSRFCYTPLVWL